MENRSVSRVLEGGSTRKNGVVMRLLLRTPWRLLFGERPAPVVAADIALGLSMVLVCRAWMEAERELARLIRDVGLAMGRSRVEAVTGLIGSWASPGDGDGGASTSTKCGRLVGATCHDGDGFVGPEWIPCFGRLGDSSAGSMFSASSHSAVGAGGV